MDGALNAYAIFRFTYSITIIIIIIIIIVIITLIISLMRMGCGEFLHQSHSRNLEQTCAKQ